MMLFEIEKKGYETVLSLLSPRGMIIKQEDSYVFQEIYTNNQYSKLIKIIVTKNMLKYFSENLFTFYQIKSLKVLYIY